METPLLQATVDVRAMEHRSSTKGSPELRRPVRRKTRDEVKRGLAEPSWVHQEQEACDPMWRLMTVELMMGPTKRFHVLMLSQSVTSPLRPQSIIKHQRIQPAPNGWIGLGDDGRCRCGAYRGWTWRLTQGWNSDNFDPHLA